MTYQLSDEEKRGVLNAPDDKQYGYFVNKVADWGEVWSLSDGERWGSLRDPDDGSKLFPVWPHPGFVEDVKDGGWEKYETKAIEVHEFLEYCKRFEADGKHVAVMHQPDGGFLHVAPDALADDLRTALEEVE